MDNSNDLKALVIRVLDKYPYTRNDDLALWLEFIRMYHRAVFDEHGHIIPEQLRHVPTQGTLARRRAIIQNSEGRYLPTSWEIARGRKIAETKYRAWYAEQMMVSRHP